MDFVFLARSPPANFNGKNITENLNEFRDGFSFFFICSSVPPGPSGEIASTDIICDADFEVDSEVVSEVVFGVCGFPIWGLEGQGGNLGVDFVWFFWAQILCFF